MGAALGAELPNKGALALAIAPLRLVDGLDWLEEHFEAWGIESLAVPALGCQNGGLRWDDVRPVLVEHLGRLGIPIELYAPR